MIIYSANADARHCVTRLVLHVRSDQEEAECPHCSGLLNKKTPILAGDEPEPICDKGGMIVALGMAIDRRPKCPHCYGRFDLTISLPNDQGEAQPPAKNL